jgi:hypothetical protein
MHLPFSERNRNWGSSRDTDARAPDRAVLLGTSLPSRTSAAGRRGPSEVSLMAKLSAKQRAKLPAKDFGLPEKARSADAKKETGNYPIPDEGHAISAKRLSRKQRKDGNLTKDEFDRINRKADKVLKAKSKD